MASCDLKVVLEFDLAEDAKVELFDIWRRLARRHGDRFRALERDFERTCEGGSLGSWPQWELEPGWIVMGVPSEIRRLLDAARQLGV
jgi:hypothetical protein